VKYGIRKVYVGDGFRKLSEKLVRLALLVLRAFSLVLQAFQGDYSAIVRFASRSNWNRRRSKEMKSPWHAPPALLCDVALTFPQLVSSSIA
jgi:hypothetical protein